MGKCVFCWKNAVKHTLFGRKSLKKGLFFAKNLGIMGKYLIILLLAAPFFHLKADEREGCECECHDRGFSRCDMCEMYHYNRRLPPLRPHTGGCAYACNCKCGHPYCDCCDKCANEHHRDCECECHKDVGLYWDDVNAACMSGCYHCEEFHTDLKRRHEYWQKHSKKPKRQVKRSARPQQKKTTPRQPRRSSGHSATR